MSDINSVLVIGLGTIGKSVVDSLSESVLPKMIYGYDPVSVIISQMSNKYSNFKFTDMKDNFDVIVVCVSVDEGNSFKDMSRLAALSRLIASNVKNKPLVILESTVPIGTTRKAFAPPLLRKGMKVAYCPERFDPGQYHNDIPRVLGGIDSEAISLATAFYNELLRTRVTAVESVEIAEASKLMENSFRLINITWAVELEKILHSEGLDYQKVLDAASTKPFGFMPFNPGLGPAGHCIPVTPFFLDDKHSSMLPLCKNFLNDRVGTIAKRIKKHLPRGSSIHILGSAYKANVTDIRMSQVGSLVDALYGYYHVTVMDAYEKGEEIKFDDMYDAAILAVPHDEILQMEEQLLMTYPVVFDPWRIIKEESKVIYV